VAIGAPAWQNHGAVYTFFSNGGTWTDPYYSCGSDSCTAFPVVGQTVSGSRFGASVSLGANGDLVVGAPGSASAYDFAYNPPSDTGENGSWSQVWMTPASAPYTGGTVVGLGVAVSGNTVLIGAPSNATNAVFVEGPPASPPPGTGAPAMADNAPLLGALLLLGGLVALSRRRPRGLAV
jgi:hypothetical protein